METTVVDGNGTEAGHIIVTTIGGRNGQPKQVYYSLQLSSASSSKVVTPDDFNELKFLNSIFSLSMLLLVFSSVLFL